MAQPWVPLIPWVTPRRNETLSPGATLIPISGASPKKSWVVWVGTVGSG